MPTITRVRSQLPPRPVCGDCRVPLTEWVPVTDTGTLLAWTVVHVPIVDSRTGQPRPTPYGMGLIRLDGADTTLNHVLDTCDEARLRIGARVRARWRAERLGAMDDIAGFELMEDEQQSRRPTTDAPPPEPLHQPLHVGLSLTFRHAAGRTGSAFLAALRDDSRITGAPCTDCGKVACPPRPCCPCCGGDAGPPTPVGPGGVLRSWTTTEAGCLGLVQLDGADTSLVHRILAPEPALHPGLRLRARFADERVGSILDLAGFELEAP